MNFEAENIPLCVDLDGTLLRSDMLIESVLLLLKINPLYLFLLPFWLLQGKSRLKQEVAQRINLDKFSFPFNKDVVEYLESEKKNGRDIILITGSNQKIADKVAGVLGLFSKTIGSSPEKNLTRENKRDYLLDEYGEHGFDYIGNDKDDLQVWPVARNALVVSAPGGLSDHPDIKFSNVFTTPKTTFKDYLSLFRVHQWSKNILVFVPFLLEQRFDDPKAAVLVLLAFAAMCALASITYVINDMLDLQADRNNRTKKSRALASGSVSLQAGVRAAVILFGMLVVVCFFLPLHFIGILFLYTAVTLLYSFYFKRVAVLDVCIIAGLHTVRVVGGTVAINAEWSFWLLAFSMFIFFSFALVKRVAELIQLKQQNKQQSEGRDYRVSDIPILMSIGASAGYLSVLVVALYINSEKVRRIYETPEALWLVCPILMYWIGRIWIKASRGDMHEDPIIFALRDRISVYILGFAFLAVIVAKTISL